MVIRQDGSRMSQRKRKQRGRNNVEQLWKDIAIFEDKEVKAWKGAESNRQEARTCARMEAYVKLMEKELE